MESKFTSIAIILALSLPTISLYNSSSSVIQLTDNSFQSIVVKSPTPVLVEFYAPWCGHCKSLAPEYNKVAKAMKGIMKVGAIDLDKYKTVGGPYGIKGFPTIKLFMGKLILLLSNYKEINKNQLIITDKELHQLWLNLF